MASLDDPGEVREGFLCPLCLKDLQSFYQLQSHYEEEHSEDRDVKGQIKSLVQKARKAKNKLLKREGDDRVEPGTQGYESFSYGGVDPYMWEPQELGAVRSHLSDFKKHRAARIDHYVVEVNKLIIRLEKLTAFDRTNTETSKIRAIEKSVVPWVNDQDVPFCPDCGNKFSIRNRRHHCRLCGSIMCKKCMELIGLPLANKLTSASKDSLSTHTSPSQSPNSVHGSRRGSISSMSSVSSVLDEKDDDRIRCCTHCKDKLLKREQQMDEKEHTPDIVKLYEKLRLCMEKVDQKAPEYIRMAASLNAGETTYSLEHANDLRVEVQKVYELIDALSKKILTLGLNQDPSPHPNTLRLQRMIRYSATLFVQEKLLGLMSLPTKEQFEELKKKRKQDLEQKRTMERQAALESRRKLEERQSGLASPAANGEVRSLRGIPAPLRKAEGWLPLSEGQGQSEDPDPLLQQIYNITSFIRQAKAAGRTDEVRTLQENLRQLQDEYDQQQTEKAIELSRRQAEEEELQREQLQMLRRRELEREQEQFLASSLHTRTRALDLREVIPFQLEPSRGPHSDLAYALDPASSPVLGSTAPDTLSPGSAQAPVHLWSGPPALGQELLLESAESQPSEKTSLNPFDEEDLSSPTEGAASPAAVEAFPGPAAALTREYNPFEEDAEEEEGAELGVGNPFTDSNSATPNPFDEDDHPRPASPPAPGNPFEECPCTNPFEVDSDSGTEAEEHIEEELLLQQIDNIKAYIFDAKQCGRMDEVEVLTENLRELKCTLAKQKGGPN
ncbi:rabenosyn-5 [Peromyscus maniculatus bairdii]|uniref:Rabenosyn, RAB effector n=1 Tax=Peromyscus maniculatus bairdii TaxID=230844 RepID=A0A6I9KX11_PERMB|nr:rabenosyn-5 [Peromyscus maniculatus bairdii]XP_042129610.1 rabenosyn-5 [Peromyscus maniculatus bairdii]XP_042129611.1 rabenosyn-5 [Peromyscus maniculatus bairdii]XP_042129612.1 rabenosyn-5 [Peromyscus maniculatus bairdii]XP_042129613.1 rabenosyn-5 [Peromyscus maniculatus bairdii]XP_042129614.1 rabenosyn-5 [Peromyscus maniculatus bairdii]